MASKAKAKRAARKHMRVLRQKQRILAKEELRMLCSSGESAKVSREQLRLDYQILQDEYEDTAELVEEASKKPGRLWG